MTALTAATVALILFVVGPSSAQQSETSLPAVLSRATAMSILGPELILVATSDGGFVCNVRVNAGLFRQVEAGVEPSPGYYPKSLCISVAEKNTTIKDEN